MDKHIKVHDICCNCVFFATEFCFDIQGCNQKKGKYACLGSKYASGNQSIQTLQIFEQLNESHI